MKNLILITVNTEKENAYLEDAVGVELVLKLKPFVPHETAELLKLSVRSMVVLNADEVIG
jgi:hypothetical protein